MKPPAPEANASRRRAWLEEGGLYLHPALGYLLAVWIAHGVLRFATLFRKDAFGTPFVGKPDWYIFHALAIDALWILGYSLPLLLALIACGGGGRRAGKIIFALLILFHSILLLFAAVDAEVMRFMGLHLDASFLSIYGNPAALRETIQFIASDRSVPYLPYILFLGCVPLSWTLYRWISRRFVWTRKPRLSWPVPTVIALSALLAYVFLHFIWPGRFRMLKLKPVVASLLESLEQGHAVATPPPDLAAIGAMFQRQWLLEQGDSSFVFPDTARPFYKVPLYRFCSAADDKTKLHAGLPVRCERDGDGDGYPARKDCDDGNARVRPGAVEVPGNGVDEDCSGIDAKPPNIVLVIMESHKGVNVGHLKPYGALAGATPFLDSLAGQGQIWTRFSVSGLPTANALISTHLSILQHPSRYIASDFTALRHHAFSTVLGEHGYHTHFFSAADPSWDGQTPWLRQWYQGFTYDRGRENDSALFAHMSRWMKDSLRADKPFLMTAMTKTNHYPFNPVEGVRPAPADSGLPGKMRATMEYTDACLRRFLHSLKDESWLENTLFVFLGDHGFPLSEHGSSNMGYGLYTESVWIPFVIFGRHPELPTDRIHIYPAGQMDIAPTLLDLAGICEANHYMGHSLLRAGSGENRLSYVIKDAQGTLEQDSLRLHGAIGDLPREQGIEVFNTLSDKMERRNLYPQARAFYDSLMPFVKGMAALNGYLVETDALWPDTR